MDPPRAGCKPELLEAVLKAAPEKIIYVSCDAGTFARDLKILTEGDRYEIKRINRFYRKNPAKEQKSQCTPHKTNYTDNSTKIHIIPFTIDIKDRSLQDITHLE